MQRFLAGSYDVFVECFAADAATSVQERVKAVLEDRGFATHAEFTVRSLGSRPPVVTALRAQSLPASQSGVVPASGHGSGGGLTTSPMLSHASGSNSAGAGGAATSGSDTASAPCSGAITVGSELHLEMEVEYNGGASFCLSADVPVVRGRQLPLRITVSDIAFRVHLKAVVKLMEPSSGTAINTGNNMHSVSAAGSVDNITNIISNPSGSGAAGGGGSDALPFVWIALQAVSEPDFSFVLDTSFTKYDITNFFGFAVLIKYLILRLVRKHLMRGVQLPPFALPQQLSRHQPAWFRSIQAPGHASSRVGGWNPTAHPYGANDVSSDVSSFTHN